MTALDNLGCFMAKSNFTSLNPIPTGTGVNQPIYSYHMTQVGRNRVKLLSKVGKLVSLTHDLTP